MIGAIEQALVNKIAAANESGAFGYKLQGVKSYHGELSGDINQIVRTLPAAWVIFGGKTRRRAFDGATHIEWELRYSVIVGAKSLRNEASSRLGADDRVGSYQIIDDLEGLLSGETLGLEMSPLVPERVIAISNNKSDRDIASIYALELSTVATINYAAFNPDDLDDLQTIHTDWDIPPHGNVLPPLPALEADARDTLILNEED